MQKIKIGIIIKDNKTNELIAETQAMLRMLKYHFKKDVIIQLYIQKKGK